MGKSFESEPHQDSPQCFQDGQLILLELSHSFLNSLARSWYLSIFSFSFSSTLASTGTATPIVWQTACCCLLQLGQAYCVLADDRSVCQNPKGFWLSRTFELSRDTLIPLVSNVQSILSAQAPMDSFCNAIMSTFIFRLSQRWAFTNYAAYWFFPTLAQPGSLLTILLSSSWIPPSSSTSKRDYLSLSVLKADHVMVFPSSPPLSHHSSVAYTLTFIFRLKNVAGSF